MSGQYVRIGILPLADALQRKQAGRPIAPDVGVSGVVRASAEEAVGRLRKHYPFYAVEVGGSIVVGVSQRMVNDATLKSLITIAEGREET